MEKEKISREELEQIAQKGIVEADAKRVFAIAEVYGSAVDMEEKELAGEQLRLAIGESVKNTAAFKGYLRELDNTCRDTYGMGYFPALIILEEMNPTAAKNREGR